MREILTGTKWLIKMALLLYFHPQLTVIYARITLIIQL